jgi:hypothetical protein
MLTIGFGRQTIIVIETHLLSCNGTQMTRFFAHVLFEALDTHAAFYALKFVLCCVTARTDTVTPVMFFFKAEILILFRAHTHHLTATCKAKLRQLGADLNGRAAVGKAPGLQLRLVRLRLRLVRLRLRLVRLVAEAYLGHNTSQTTHPLASDSSRVTQPATVCRQF